MDSKTLFAERKEAKDLPSGPRITALLDLKMHGLRLVAFDSDKWNQLALAWVLIDLCKAFVETQNYPQAQANYQELMKLEVDDEIIESQQEYLAKIVDPFHDQVKALNQKSKDGLHDDAIAGFGNLFSTGHLAPAQHESYAWAIYRLLKAKAPGYTSVQVRRWLKRYLDLKNERPSMVHSTILGWTMKYAETDPELRTMDFLKIWDATKFQREDFRESSKDDITYSSLYSRLCRRLIADPRGVDVAYLLDAVDTQPGYGDEENDVRIVDGLRESYFWKLFNLHKDGKLGSLWQEFTAYATEYGQYPPSHWHSEILQLANRFMKETNEYRFLPFFKAWNPENLRKKDWKEKKKGEIIIPPTAKKALKTACGQALKRAVVPGSLDWLVAVCKDGKKRIPKDEYIPRDFAHVLNHNGQTKEAIAAYRKLALTLGDKYYVWNEFANLIPPSQHHIKAGMLAKALTLERNEDFLGDVRLNMAACLLELEGEAGAAYELATYHQHRTLQGWKIDDRYAQLKSRLPDSAETNTAPDYRKLVTAADEFAYKKVPWVTMTVIDRYKNKDGKQKIKLYTPPEKKEKKKGIMAWLEDEPIETILTVNERRFKLLRKVKQGDTLRVKYHKLRFKEHDSTVYRPLLIEVTDQPAWAGLPLTHAIIDYINKEKQIAHAVTTENVQAFFPLKQVSIRLHTGDFISGRLLTETKKDGNKRISLQDVKAVSNEEAAPHFTEYLTLVDSVNPKKQLFHFVTEGTPHGIVKFENTKFRPVPGDHFRIRAYSKLNKKTKERRLNIIQIVPTEEVLSSKIKHTSGSLEVIHKSDKTFGFVNDLYVPGYMLDQAGIFNDCEVSATAIKSDGKWRVVTIE
jgi:hypothetical protein